MKDLKIDFKSDSSYQEFLDNVAKKAVSIIKNQGLLNHANWKHVTARQCQMIY